MVWSSDLMVLLGPFNEHRGFSRSTSVEIELPLAALLREDFLASATELFDKVAVD